MSIAGWRKMQAVGGVWVDDGAAVYQFAWHLRVAYVFCWYSLNVCTRMGATYSSINALFVGPLSTVIPCSAGAAHEGLSGTVHYRTGWTITTVGEQFSVI